MKDFFIYILANPSNSILYTGVTNSLERRIFEHKNKLFKGFTSKYNLIKLIYFEICSDIEAALNREKQIKKMSREAKERLINKLNKEWADLSENWYKLHTASVSKIATLAIPRSLARNDTESKTRK